MYKLIDSYTGAVMNDNMTVDSYECKSCGLWSNYGRDAEEPVYCPYCGNESLRWRTDNHYEFTEIN